MQKISYVYKGYRIKQTWSNKDLCWYWSAIKVNGSNGCGNLPNEKAARIFVESKMQ